MRGVTYPKVVITSVNHLRSVLQECNTKRTTVLLRGCEYSSVDHFCSNQNGIVLDLGIFKAVTLKDGIVTAGGGNTWTEILEKIVPQGYYIESKQSSNTFTVGGSISSNVHGRSIRNPQLRDILISITIMLANGDVKTIRPGDVLFDYVVGGFGLFGVIIRARIKAGKDFAAEMVIKEYDSVDEITRILRNRSSNLIKFYACPHFTRIINGSGKGFMVKLYYKTSNSKVAGKCRPLNKIYVPRLLPPKLFKRILNPMSDDYMFKKNCDKIISNTEFKCISESDETFSFKNTYFNLGRHIEFFIPLQYYELFLRNFISIFPYNIYNRGTRYMYSQSSTKLNYVKPNRKYLSLVIGFKMYDKDYRSNVWKKFMTDVIELLLLYDTRFHLCYKFAMFVPNHILYKIFPSMPEFIHMKQRHDPNNIFRTRFYDKISVS